MNPICSFSPEEVETGGSLELVSIPRRAAEVVLLPAHTGTNVHVYTPMQVRGDRAAFVCPSKRTDPKCAKFTRLKEVALSIHSRSCKAEGRHWRATDNAKPTARRWSLPLQSTFDPGKYHLKFIFVTFGEPNKQNKEKLGWHSCPASISCSKSGCPLAGHMRCGL